MASINKVILVGNLGAAPDAKDVSGNTLCTLSLATSRRYNDRNGQQVDETEWHRVVLFGRVAEIARDYLRKGSQVYIEGRLRTRKYTDKEGIERYTTEVVGQNLQLLDRRGDVQQASGNAPYQEARPAPQRPAASPSARPAYDEEVPF